LDNLVLLKEADYFSEIQDSQLEPVTISTRPHSRYETVEQSSTDILSQEVGQELNLIQKLSELIAEDLQSAPAASIEQLVERLQRDKRIERIIQINEDNAVGFQTLVEGGTANVGSPLHDFDADKLEQVLKAFWKSLQPKESPNNVPRSGVAKFVGRDEELEQIHTQLQKSEPMVISAISGMVGVGKTELAIQYAKAFEAAYPAGICWLLAREMNVGTQIVGYAIVQLGLQIPDGTELPDQVRFCWRNWPEGDALIVLDDVTNYSEVEPYLPPENPRFKVLLTTRLKFGSPVQTLPLGVLYTEKSLELLEVLVGKERVAAELAVAQSLCEWLGHLPLGLELVGRYLALREDLSISKMLFRLLKAKLRKAIEDEALEVSSDTWTATAKRGINAAFELTWEMLDEKSQHLGKLLSLFALAPIPWKLAEKVKQKYCEIFPENGEFVAEEFKKARTALLRNHLLQVAAGQDTYQLHALVREFFRSKLENEDSPQSINTQSFISAISEDAVLIQPLLQSKLENVLCGRQVEFDSIPDDNHQGTIQAVENIESFNIYREGIEYRDDRHLVIPFRACVACLLNYLISKADYYSLGEERDISISESNEHYFSAEELYRLEIEGLTVADLNLSVLADSILTKDEIANLLPDMSISIETIVETGALPGQT
jgi:hypothetical protein